MGTILACLIYTLTRICSVGYTKRVELVFEVMAEPNRRAILSLLVSSQQSGRCGPNREREKGETK